MKNYRFFFLSSTDDGGEVMCLRRHKPHKPYKFATFFSSIGGCGQGDFTLKEVVAAICMHDTHGGLEFFPDGDPESAFIVHVGDGGDHIHFWRGRHRRACARIAREDHQDVSWLKALKLLIWHANEVNYEAYYEEE